MHGQVPRVRVCVCGGCAGGWGGPLGYCLSLWLMQICFRPETVRKVDSDWRIMQPDVIYVRNRGVCLWAARKIFSDRSRKPKSPYARRAKAGRQVNLVKSASVIIFPGIEYTDTGEFHSSSFSKLALD